MDFIRQYIPKDRDYPPHSETHQRPPVVRQSAMQHPKRQ